MVTKIELTTVFFVVVFFALLNTAGFLLADKWGVISWYELKRRPWMPPKCEFCLYFWLAFIELLGWYFIYLPFDFVGFLSIFALSLCAAVISRFFQ